MEAGTLRHTLRNKDTESLERRRKLILLSAIGLVDFAVISLYQTGVIERLPDIPISRFDSNKVNASASAYQFGVPDGTLSSLAYAATMVLAAAGANESSKLKSASDIALAATVAVSAAGALFYLKDMLFKQKKVCVYCLAGAAINLASVNIIAPVLLQSLKKRLRRTPDY